MLAAVRANIVMYIKHSVIDPEIKSYSTAEK